MRDKLFRRLKFSVLTWIAVSLVAQSSLASGSTLTISDGRPVAAGVQELITRYGYVITYEDPRYSYDADVEDVTNLVTSDGRPNRRILVPRTSTLIFSVPSLTSIDQNAMLSSLQSLVQAQRNVGQGGRFDILQAEGVFHLIPTQVRDETGNWISQGSILDTLITLPSEKRNEFGVFAAICNAIAAATHTKISVAGFSGGIYSRSNPAPYLIGASHERARDVLMKALSLMQDPSNKRWSVNKMSWLLFFDPTNQSYVLNIVDVPTVTSSTT